MVQTKEQQTPIEVLPVKEEKDLYQWEALERPYQTKDKEFWTTALSILGLVSLILIFVKEWFLIAALFALAFFYYVLTTVPPQKAKYKITNKGVYLGISQRVDWENLKRFWFDRKWGHDLLHLETLLNFPKVISFVINTAEKGKVESIIAKFIPKEETSPNFLDKFSTWVTKKLPLETK